MFISGSTVGSIRRRQTRLVRLISWLTRYMEHRKARFSENVSQAIADRQAVVRTTTAEISELTAIKADELVKLPEFSA